MTEDERNAMFDECFEYDDYLRANGHSAGGEALQPPETALTLYWRNGKVATNDAPYVETKEQLGGIGVLEARGMNHAIRLLSQHPVLKYGAAGGYRFGDAGHAYRPHGSQGTRPQSNVDEKVWEDGDL